MKVHFCGIGLDKTRSSPTTFCKDIYVLIKIHPAVLELKHADGQTGNTDMISPKYADFMHTVQATHNVGNSSNSSNRLYTLYTKGPVPPIPKCHCTLQPV
jgi:hypothetical protein